MVRLKENEFKDCGKELCDIFDEYDKDNFFLGLMYLLHEKDEQIDRKFLNEMLSVLGKAEW